MTVVWQVRAIRLNVLIEIGAAIALYGKKIVLLVEKGVELPSNLQGLYRCECEGDRLDYNATMKILKAFNQFR
jgi:predicted nucleotide-binding protein